MASGSDPARILNNWTHARDDINRSTERALSNLRRALYAAHHRAQPVPPMASTTTLTSARAKGIRLRIDSPPPSNIVSPKCR